MHHCQGHRLAMVVGSRDNPSIAAALAWIQSLKNVQHTAFFDTPTQKQPQFDKVLSFVGGQWSDVSAGAKDPVPGFLKSCQDCCHWDEAILVCHGHQKDIWYALLKNLGRLLGDRPVRKFVLWMCKSASEFCPKHPLTYEGHKPDGKPERLTHINLFEQIADILKPKSCSVDSRCGCTHENCDCRDADGGVVPGHCPKDEAVSLLCAAWYDAPLQDESVVSRPAPLGIDGKDGAQAQGDYWLTSPDGNLREVTIGADGSVTTKAPHGSDDVFAGTPLKGDEGLKNPDNESNKDSLNPAQRMVKTQTEAPAPAADPAPAYNGPKRCDHTTHEGCQLNAT